MAYSLTDTPLCVYGIFDTSDPERIRYVGLTTLGIKRRFAGHWSQAAYTNLKRPIYLWMRKRTRDQIGIRVLESAEDIEHLKVLERFHIAQYRELEMADLNLTDGGESSSGSKWSDEMREAHSVRMSGAGNPMYGKKRGREFMEWVKSHRGPMSESHKNAIRENQKKTQASEVRARAGRAISKALSTPEHRQRMSEQMTGANNPQFGRKYTEEEGHALSMAMSRFTEDDIREIRRLKTTGLLNRDIAARYNVDQSQISKIVNRKRYGWIE